MRVKYIAPNGEAETILALEEEVGNCGPAIVNAFSMWRGLTEEQRIAMCESAVVEFESCDPSYTNDLNPPAGASPDDEGGVQGG